LIQLPCPNLRELNLSYIKLQLSGSSTQPRVLHSCTRLNKLLLQYCQFVDGHSSLSALSSLVPLQHLELIMGAVVSRPTNDACLPSTLLQHLTELTHLCLQHADQLLNADSLQHASCLVNLQELHITGSSFPLSHSTTPGWSRLTALRKVSIQRASLDPSILQDCTQLHGLALHWVNIVGAGGAAALLSLLGRLQQLKSLKFFQPEYDWPAAAYTSLTASSHLHELAVYIDSLPPGVWQCVFPSDRQLPALRDLTLSAYEWDESHPLPASASGTDDISRLASCCPGLHKITIDVQPGAQLSPLAKVSGLTSLSVSGLHEEGFESLRALSELVSLQELSVEPGRPITPQDLLRLTALTGLTRLCIDPHTAPEFEGEADVDVDLIQVCAVRAD